MTDQQAQTLKNRVAANPRSPLFARLAEFYLGIGKNKEALSLCDKGLAHYSDYVTAHLIKGKALAALNMFAEARREYEYVAQALPSNAVAVELLKNIASMADAQFSASPELPQPSVEETFGTEPQAFPASVDEVPPSFPDVDASPAPIDATVPEGFGTQEVSPLSEELPPEFMQARTEEPAPAEESATVDESDPFASLWGKMAQETGVEQPEQAPQAAPGFIDTGEDPFAAMRATESASEQQPQEMHPAETGADIFAMPPFGAETGVESFDEFSARISAELAGTENSITLEEYLLQPTASPEFSGPAPSPFGAEPTEPESSEEASAQSGDEESTAQAGSIEELTNKLQEVKRITPVINLSDGTLVDTTTEPEPEPSAAPVAETTAEEEEDSIGFVTPTLAEIYAKQGWYDDAIKAYKTLSRQRPAEKEKFLKRVEELQAQKAQK